MPEQQVPPMQANPQQGQGQGQQLELAVSPELEYHYRDLINVSASPEAVVLEFGNYHRTMQNRATLHNRMVLSFAGAVRLLQSLDQSLRAVQDAVRKQQEEAQAQLQSQGAVDGGDKKKPAKK